MEALLKKVRILWGSFCFQTSQAFWAMMGLMVLQMSGVLEIFMDVFCDTHQLKVSLKARIAAQHQIPIH